MSRNKKIGITLGITAALILLAVMLWLVLGKESGNTADKEESLPSLSGETLNSYGAVSSAEMSSEPETISYKDVPIEDLPADYGWEQAEKDGVYGAVANRVQKNSHETAPFPC